MTNPDVWRQMVAAVRAHDLDALGRLVPELQLEDVPVKEPGVLRRFRLAPAAPGFELEATVYTATPTRPASFPPSLPFLPGAHTSLVMRFAATGPPSARYLCFTDPAGALDAVVEQSSAAGWAREASDQPGPDSGSVSLVRPGERRVVRVEPMPVGAAIDVTDSLQPAAPRPGEGQ